MRPRSATLLHHLRRLVAPAAAPDADAALLERFACCRDEAAFAAIVARHGPMVLGLCRRVLGDVHAAEDAFQATFLVLARRAGTIRRRDSLAAWLHGVAYRVALKARTAALRRRRHEGQAPARASSEAGDPLDRLSARELLAILDAEVQRLPETYRLPIILCCLAGHSQEEAARLLGWTPGSVRGRLERGRARLHARLVRRGVALSAGLLALELSRGVVSAALPAFLGGATTAAALRFAAGHGPEAGVSVPAAALAEGVLRGPAAARGKVAALLLLLAAGLALAGAGALGRQGREAGATGREPPPAAAEQEQEPRVDRWGDRLPPGAVARLGTTRFRPNGDRVAGLAFAPDGKSLAAGGYETPVTLVDVASGKDLLTFAGAPRRAGSLAFSPDGKALAGATFEGAMSLWEVATGKEVHQFGGSPGTCPVFSPDGKLVASVHAPAIRSGGPLPPPNATVRIYEARTGRLVRELRRHQDEAVGAAFAPDGKTLVSAARDGTLRLWDVATGQTVRSIHDSERGAHCVAFAPDGKVVASGGADGTIRLWDAATGGAVRHFFAHRLGVYALAYAPDGRALASMGQQAEPVRLWDPAAGTEVRHWPMWFEGMAHSLAFAPDGRTLAVAGSSVQLWDVATGRDVRPFPGNEGEVLTTAFTPDGRGVVVAGGDPVIHLWDAVAGREVRRFEGHTGVVDAVAVSADGTTLSSVCRDMTARVWDLATGKELRRVRLNQEWLGYAALTTDGTLLASVEADKVIRLTDLTAGKEVRRLVEDRKESITRLTFSPDGRLLASGGRDGDVRVWDVAAGRQLRRLMSPERELQALAFSSDGRTLATSGNGQAFRLWEVATGGQRGRAGDEAAPYPAATFAPDGRLLVWTLPHGDCAVWDLVRGAMRDVLVNRRGTAWCLAFSPDGRRLVSGNLDTTAVVWDATRFAPAEPARPSARDLESLWQALADGDATTAYRAVLRLGTAPRLAVPWLRERLRPAAPVERSHLDRLVADLDADAFAVRAAAFRELEDLGERAESALRRGLAGRPSVEARRRLDELRDKVEQAVPSPEQRRGVRAVEVLERAGNVEARKVLRALAEGAADARLTREARTSLARLGPRAPAIP